MERRERWILAASTTILMSIAFSVSLHNMGMGICLGICMGTAFGLFDSGDDGDE